jgi:hypothetical protein
MEGTLLVMQGLVKKFENTPAYYVIYAPGAGGSFLRLLVYSLYYPNELNYSFSKANAHYDVPLKIKNDRNYVSESIPKKILDKKKLEDPNFVYKFRYQHHLFYKRHSAVEFELAEPLDESRPLVFTNHIPISFNRYKIRFPLGKILIISHTPKEEKLIRGNFFYKSIRYVVADMNDLSVSYLNQWKKICRLHNISTENPMDATTEEVDKYLSSFEENFQYVDLGKFYDYHSDIYEFKFYDIMNNKDKTLNDLSIITGKDINEGTVNLYESYLNSQRKLLEEKMPWAL